MNRQTKPPFRTQYQRLLEDIESCGNRTEDGCLIWKYSCSGQQPWNNMQGYGKVWTGDKYVAVHRAVWHHFVDKSFPLWMDKEDRGGLVPNYLCPNTNCYELTHLELETMRNNVIKGKRSNLKEDMSSRHVGVHWDKARSKWVAKTYWNGVHRNLGGFLDEIDAANAYQEFFKTHIEGEIEIKGQTS